MTLLLLFVHIAIALIDVGGVYNLADFMVRPDGSQQDPDNMLPVEKVLVTMIAFPFLTVVLAFFLAPRSSAALVAAATHFCYTLHQIVLFDTWKALFHPDTDLSMTFFITGKVVWMFVCILIWYLEKENTKAKTSIKKKA